MIPLSGVPLLPAERSARALQRDEHPHDEDSSASGNYPTGLDSSARPSNRSAFQIDDCDTEHPDKKKDPTADAVQLHAHITGDEDEGEDEPGRKSGEPKEGRPTTELFDKERQKVSPNKVVGSKTNLFPSFQYYANEFSKAAQLQAPTNQNAQQPPNASDAQSQQPPEKGTPRPQV